LVAREAGGGKRGRENSGKVKEVVEAVLRKVEGGREGDEERLREEGGRIKGREAKGRPKGGQREAKGDQKKTEGRLKGDQREVEGRRKGG
jgi:hypothetical protein